MHGHSSIYSFIFCMLLFEGEPTRIGYWKNSVCMVSRDFLHVFLFLNYIFSFMNSLMELFSCTRHIFLPFNCECPGLKLEVESVKYAFYL